MCGRENQYQLSRLIQLDDVFFGDPDDLQGRGSDKTPLYIAFSTTDDGKPLYVKMKAVEIINMYTALEFATQVISKGCTITTDG